MRSLRKLVPATAAVLAVLAFPGGSALAASSTESVQGTALSTISLSAGTGATFLTNFNPGGTATASGALTAVDTNPSWTLAVKDSATTDPGHMGAGATGCTGSDAFLTNPLKVSVTSPLGGVTSAGSVAISGADQTVASAT